jgi:hypothetical protein
MDNCIAFEGNRRIATGELSEVAEKTKRVVDRGERGPVVILDAVTSRTIEVDFRGTVDAVLERLRAKPAEIESAEPRGKGRPKLGVVGREVTLLPRHWEWLSSQPGGASVALRWLVEEARKISAPQDRKRETQESAYRFMTIMAGNRAGYEEGLRAMYAGKQKDFERSIKDWPEDVRKHALVLGRRAMER